jgi:hypothetical protein
MDFQAVCNTKTAERSTKLSLTKMLIGFRAKGSSNVFCQNLIGENILKIVDLRHSVNAFRSQVISLQIGKELYLTSLSLNF